MDLTEREETRRSNKYQPCDETSNDMQTSERVKRFQDCCKTEIWKYVSSKINCTIPGYEAILGNYPKFNSCSDYVSAANSHVQLGRTMKQLTKNVSKGIISYLEISLQIKTLMF
jgi:hypothetical protein